MTSKKKTDEVQPEKTAEVPYEAKIQARLKVLETERDRFVQQANQQIAAYNGAIGELQRLIEPEPEPTPESPPPDPEVEPVEEESLLPPS